MKKHIIVASLVAMSLVTSISGCKNKIETYQHTDFAMGTVTNVTLYGTGNLQQIESDLIQDMKDIEEKQMSWRVKGSALAKLNANLSKKPKVEKPLKGWLEDAIEISKASYGSGRNAVDPTIGQLTQLWDFESEDPKAPKKADINQVIKQDLTQSSKGVTIAKDGTVTSKNVNTKFDLGAYGKGIGNDEAKDFLSKEKGVTGAMVALGGSILVEGEKPDGEPWKIAVQHPDTSSTKTFGILTMKEDGFISTSGDYEKFFKDEASGKTYFHILDSKTGYSVKTDITSCTVVCDSGIISDGLSTACFTLGMEGSKKLLKKYNAKVVFVTKDKNVYVSKGLEFSLEDNEYKLHQI